MSRLRMCICLFLINALQGCFVATNRQPIGGVLPDRVGGLPIDRLVVELPDVQILNIEIEKIVLSNNIVTVMGSLLVDENSNRTFRINPVMFRNALSSAILFFIDGDASPFRLVADDEFRVIDYVSRNQVYGLRTLVAGGGKSERFFFDYKGFPSNSVSMSNRNDMNIIHMLKRVNEIKYYIKTCVCVMYDDENYDLPNADEAYVNISGTGECLLEVE